MTRIFVCRGEDGRALDWPLLAEAARLCWGWTELPETARSPRGKPYFVSVPDRWFSLSHSRGFAMCSLSDDGPVGVDIEQIRPRRESLLDRALSENERAICGNDWSAFTRLWTLKESWCKQTDAPLWPPDKVETPPPCPHRSWRHGELWVSVCCTGEPPEMIEWLENITPVSA